MQLFFLTKNGIIGSAASYFLTLTLARHLGPTEFGRYSYVMIIGSIASVLVSFSTDNTAPVLFAHTKDDGAVIGAVYSVRLFLFGFVALCLPWAYCVDPALAFGVVAIAAFSLNLGFFYECTGSAVRYSYIYLVERIAYVSVVLLFILFGAASVTRIFEVLLLVTGASCVWQLYSNRATLKNVALLDGHALGRVLQNNMFLVLIALATFVYGGFSRLIFESRFGLKELGIYSAGWQLTTAITLFQAQVDRLWRLKLSSALLNRNLQSFTEHVKSYLILTTLPVIGLSLLVYLIAPQLIGLLFGEKYVLLRRLMPIFCLYFPIINLHGLSVILWIGLGNRTEYLLTSLIASAAFIALLLALPVELGLPSFAMAVVCSHGLSVLYLLLRFYAKHIRPLKQNDLYGRRPSMIIIDWHSSEDHASFNESLLSGLELARTRLYVFSGKLFSSRHDNVLLTCEGNRVTRAWAVFQICWANRSDSILFLTYDPVFVVPLRLFCSRLLVYEHNTTPEGPSLSKHAVWQRLFCRNLIRLAQFPSQMEVLVKLKQRCVYLGSPLKRDASKAAAGTPESFLAPSWRFQAGELLKIKHILGEREVLIKRGALSDESVLALQRDLLVTPLDWIDLGKVLPRTIAIVVTISSNTRGSGWFNEAIRFGVPLIITNRDVQEIFRKTFPQYPFVDPSEVRSPDELDALLRAIRAFPHDKYVDDYNRGLRGRFADAMPAMPS